MSLAGTVAWPFWEGGQTQAALFAGIAHYPKDGRHFAVHAGDFVPIGGLQIRHRNGFVQVIPGDGKAAAGVISFGLTFQSHK